MSKVVELKEQLVHANVSFSTEIMDMQEIDTNAINKLIDIIAAVKNTNFKPSDYVTTTLIPPVVLILQLIEMTLSSIGNIASVFLNMGITVDPYYFLSQYVPHIDWDEFKKASQQKIIDDKTKQTISGGEGGGSPGGVF